MGGNREAGSVQFFSGSGVDVSAVVGTTYVCPLWLVVRTGQVLGSLAVDGDEPGASASEKV